MPWGGVGFIFSLSLLPRLSRNLERKSVLSVLFPSLSFPFIPPPPPNITSFFSSFGKESAASFLFFLVCVCLFAGFFFRVRKLGNDYCDIICEGCLEEGGEGGRTFGSWWQLRLVGLPLTGDLQEDQRVDHGQDGHQVLEEERTGGMDLVRPFGHKGGKKNSKSCTVSPNFFFFCSLSL